MVVSPKDNHLLTPSSSKNNNNKGIGQNLNKHSNGSQIYAWNILESANSCDIPDTVSQSPHTELVQGRTHQYTLDRVYDPQRRTQELYESSVQGLVQAAMEGYHTSIIAYGQTSTGKTHTMSGTQHEPGIIPLAVQECFQYLQKSKQEQPRDYLIRISYLEVYKEHIRDLLSSSSAPPPIRIFETKDQGILVRNCTEKVVTTPQQVFQALAQGEARRQIGATQMNLHSSRSHVIVRLTIESTQSSSSGNGTKPVRVSTLSLVDLAGSESVKLTGGNADRRQEGHFINQSLMTLGKVVYALSENEKKHIPYRDSKLTRLLQPSLSGNAQVVIICCISPLVSHVEESHNTFKFAIRAKKIPQRATVVETVDDKTLLQSYKQEIEDLKQQLKEAREQRTFEKLDIAEEMETDEEIKELVKAINTMEHLILRSSPRKPEDLLEFSETIDNDDDDDDALMAFSNGTPIATPVKTPHEDLRKELGRVQGLLGSVLKKRQEPSDEVRNLREQLEKQEQASSMRKADSSFLQNQLEEKDKLLSEVSKVLEAVEERQSQLENENERLRQQVWQLQKELENRAEI